MINKKNVLGKAPFDLGDKDAVHVAIVAVRAGKVIRPGQRCGLNERKEAVPDSKGCGVADPFLNRKLMVGEKFWLLLNQAEVPNVQHVWEHPELDFAPPTEPPQENRYLKRWADELGVTYEQLIDACNKAVDTWEGVPYPGTKTEEELEDVIYDARWEVFAEWAEETGYEFENIGSACCPEYHMPEELFTFYE